ncbi:hypothetical protein JCM30566_04000 [Marinitoga arctica]
MNGILNPDKKVKYIVFSGIGMDLDIVNDEEILFEYEDFPENIDIESYIKDEIWFLKIKQKSDSFISKMFGFSFNFSSKGSAKLKVNSNILAINIDDISGDISLNKMMLDELNAKTVSGDIEIYNSKIKHLKYYSTSGDLEIANSSIYSLEIKTVSGDCEIDYLVEDFKEAKIKTVSGDVELYVAGRKEVFLNKNTLPSGEVYADLSLKIEHSTKRFIDFKSVSGDLTIKEKKNIGNNNVVFEEEEIKTNNLLTPEEQKTLELYIKGKINKEFAIELLENLGYAKEDAENFLKNNFGRKEK